MPRKVEPDMPRKLTFTRVFVDPEALLKITRLADAEGRHKQRQMGIILERIAQLLDDDPQKLIDIGLLSKFNLARVA